MRPAFHSDTMPDGAMYRGHNEMGLGLRAKAKIASLLKAAKANPKITICTITYETRNL